MKFLIKNVFFLFFVFFIQSTTLNAQDERPDFISVGAEYGTQFPFGDMKDRFGQNFVAGLSLNLFKQKFNGIFSIEGQFMFGNKVNEDVLSDFRLSNGGILGSDGVYADVLLRQRGSYLGIKAEKVVLPRKSNKNAGIAVGFGLGIIQHKIRIQVDSNNAPQFSDNYSKGYDRNSRGLALKQSITYNHIGLNKNMNYSVGLTLYEGFTKSVRNINFDTGLKDDSSRLDLLLSLSFKWFIPLKDQIDRDKEIFY